MTRSAPRRSSARNWRIIAARAVIGVALFALTVLLWLLILTIWIDAAMRSFSPVSTVLAAAVPWS